MVFFSKSMGKGKGSSNGTLTGIIIISIVFIIAILLANKEIIHESFFGDYKKYSIEYYYMDTCGHCIDFNESGVWENLLKLEFNNVSLKKYNRSEKIERVNSLGITGFPSFVIVENSTSSPKIIDSFEMSRTYDNLYKFINKYENKQV
jgi:hypothetical protein